ncbi:hypothetical protein EXU85_20540 [Spirosoma sp. KCTC 42546]|uniref:hypothetical protein n=1 Tax=Spirosoma sp. KCTC 42546 TaxID=2520506 RepID=UPI00115BBE27|nr:hypothetical protein [Spirosoma sp. KCTC 42546]QDK80869.1 hypothetical protein EXU85_20540 [Spirosoma sp. KCTC 42546]
MEPKKENNNHSFDYHLACALKVVEKAILVGYFEFWISENEKRKSSLHFRQGEYWTYTTVPELIKIYPYMKGSSVYRWLEQLEADGWLKSARLNEKNIDQTRWYGRGKRLMDWLKIPIYQNDNSDSQNGKWSSQNDNSGYQNDNSDSQNGNSAIYKDTVVNAIVNPVVNAHKKNAGEGDVLEVEAEEVVHENPDDENNPNPVARAPSPSELSPEDSAELERFTNQLQSERRVLEHLSKHHQLRGEAALEWIALFVSEQWAFKNLTTRSYPDVLRHCLRWIKDQLFRLQADEQRQSKSTNNRRAGSHQSLAQTGSELDDLAGQLYAN